jgi:hypothetical protein
MARHVQARLQRRMEWPRAGLIIATSFDPGGTLSNSGFADGRRLKLNDEQWAVVEPLLPPARGSLRSRRGTTSICSERFACRVSVCGRGSYRNLLRPATGTADRRQGLRLGPARYTRPRAIRRRADRAQPPARKQNIRWPPAASLSPRWKMERLLAWPNNLRRLVTPSITISRIPKLRPPRPSASAPQTL